MIRAGTSRAALAVALVALPSIARAQSEDRFSADVAATASYSNNPFAITGSDTGSALFGLDIVPRYQRLTAQSTLTISGDVGLQQYVRRYGRNDNYSAAADYVLRTSEQVTSHARLDYSNGVLGGLNTYQPGFATTTTTTTTTTPVLPATSLSPLVPLTDIGLYGLRNRRQLGRISGDVSVAVSARDSFTLSGYGEIARYNSLPQFSNYEGYSASLGYSRRISDRFSLGLRGSASAYNYRSNNSNSRVFPIEATASGRLSPLWTIDGSLGVTFVESGTVGSTRQTSVSGSANACRQGQLSTMCLQAARQVSPTGLVGTQYVTSAGASWTRRLGVHDNLSLSGNYSKVGGDGNRLVLGGLPLQTQYAQATVGYDRQLRQRLRLIASANYRQLLDNNNGRPADFGGQVGLSYRIGDSR